MSFIEFLVQKTAGGLSSWKTEGRSTTFTVTYWQFWNDTKLVANRQSVSLGALPLPSGEFSVCVLSNIHWLHENGFTLLLSFCTQLPALATVLDNEAFVFWFPTSAEGTGRELQFSLHWKTGSGIYCRDKKLKLSCASLWQLSKCYLVH